MRIGLVASALASAAVTTFVGGYAAAATGATNPFVAVADLTSSNVLLFGLLVAIASKGSPRTSPTSTRRVSPW